MDLVDAPDKAGVKLAKARLDKKKKAMMRDTIATTADLIATTVGQAASAVKPRKGFGK